MRTSRPDLIASVVLAFAAVGVAQRVATGPAGTPWYVANRVRDDAPERMKTNWQRVAAAAKNEVLAINGYLVDANSRLQKLQRATINTKQTNEIEESDKAIRFRSRDGKLRAVAEQEAKVRELQDRINKIAGDPIACAGSVGSISMDGLRVGAFGHLGGATLREKMANKKYRISIIDPTAGMRELDAIVQGVSLDEVLDGQRFGYPSYFEVSGVEEYLGNRLAVIVPVSLMDYSQPSK